MPYPEDYVGNYLNLLFHKIMAKKTKRQIVRKITKKKGTKMTKKEKDEIKKEEIVEENSDVIDKTGNIKVEEK